MQNTAAANIELMQNDVLESGDISKAYGGWRFDVEGKIHQSPCSAHRLSECLHHTSVGSGAILTPDPDTSAEAP